MKIKKVTALFAAAIFAASFSVAQNDATVEQNNNYNMADVEQTGSNEAKLTQTSTASDQSEKNQAFVTQSGQGNFLDYDVKGHSNQLESSQLGYGNQAIIEQAKWKDSDNNYGNHVILEQTSYGGGEGDFEGTETGYGSGNHAYLKLKGDENHIRVEQQGSGNYVGGAMMPEGGESGEEGPEVLNGGGETAFFKYEGDGSDIDIEQDGMGNAVLGAVHNSYGVVDIKQDNLSNLAAVQVGGMESLKFRNEIHIDQSGSFNGTWVHQGSNANIADVDQTGMRNASMINQQ
jgi:hypothetical protein